MEKDYTDHYHKIEETYWFFRGRRDMILKLLPSKKSEKILDIGCSGGILVSELVKHGYSDVHGVDIDKSAVKNCTIRGLKNIKLCNASGLPYKDNYFDFLISSDILEHIEKDKQAVKEWYRILKKNGTLLIFVPAFMFLWSHHDVVNMHKRRYSKKQLIAVLKSAGFKISDSSYWNVALFFPLVLIRTIKNILKSKSETGDLYKCSPVVNSLLLSLLKFENWLISAGIRFPVGTSVLVKAVKR